VAGVFQQRGEYGFFYSTIQDRQNLIVPAVCLYEVFKKVLLQFGEESALQEVAVMTLGQVIELDRDLAIASALISVQQKLSMVDSIILATANSYNAILWTQDEHFMNIPNIKFIQKK
jgi:toxin FitB